MQDPNLQHIKDYQTELEQIYLQLDPTSPFCALKGVVYDVVPHHPGHQYTDAELLPPCPDQDLMEHWHLERVGGMVLIPNKIVGHQQVHERRKVDSEVTKWIISNAAKRRDTMQEGIIKIQTNLQDKLSQASRNNTNLLKKLSKVRAMIDHVHTTSGEMPLDHAKLMEYHGKIDAVSDKQARIDTEQLSDKFDVMKIRAPSCNEKGINLLLDSLREQTKQLKALKKSNANSLKMISKAESEAAKTAKARH